MKLLTLTENTSCREDLTPQHGLSLYIETGSRRVLFDSGQSRVLLDNAEALGVALSTVDTAVLSHGHYDHGGGLPAFLEVNRQAPVYVSDRAFGAFYHGPERYVGLDPVLRGNPRLIPVGTKTSLGDGLTLIPAREVPTPHPIRSFGLEVREQEGLRPDDFVHEQYLLLEEQGKTILFSGCSHRGILNIAEYFRPDVLIGGFHFMDLDPEGDGRQSLQEAAEALLALPTRYYTCHCTGVAQYEFLKTIMGDRLSYLSAGSGLEL